MNISNFVTYLHSKKLIVLVIYFLLILFCFVSKTYNNKNSLTNNQIQTDEIYDIDTLNEEQKKIRFKENFHLNIFDFQSFKSVKWQEKNHSGPCVNTRIEPTFKICVYNAKEDVFVSRSIIESGSYEPKVTMILKEFLSIWPNEENDKTVMLDVGANLGIYGLYVANLGFRVWAVEPQVQNLIKMYRSTMMSNLLDNIIFVQNGIDQVRRNITMHIDEDNNGGSFVDLDDSINSRTRLEGFKKEQPIIETALLGDLLKATMAHDNPTRIVVKMDIEGFECRAILGSKDIFEQSPIAAVVMEWFFKVKGERGPCPEAKVEELTIYMLSNKFVPFAWGIKDNTIVRLDTTNNGKDWFSNALIWLHHPSLPPNLSNNDTIVLSNRVTRIFE